MSDPKRDGREALISDLLVRALRLVNASYEADRLGSRKDAEYYVFQAALLTQQVDQVRSAP